MTPWYRTYLVLSGVLTHSKLSAHNGMNELGDRDAVQLRNGGKGMGKMACSSQILHGQLFSHHPLNRSVTGL